MPTYTLGRDFESPFSIDEKHSSVSHNHASINVEDEVWTLIDNDSTNGTFIEDNGKFRQCKKIRISPSTWIRLGEQGHRGYYFKARRVLYPKDYSDDFEELYETYQELEECRLQFDSHKRAVKFITPILMCVGLFLSFLPGIRDNGLAVRASFMLPGFISPFIQDLMLNKLEKKIKNLQGQLICPKCRRTLGKDDIINREHSFCHAH